jgi:hypothetical protein
MINGEPEYLTTDFLVTESTFQREEDLSNVVLFLRNRKVTGKLIVDFNSGGIVKIAVTQKSKAERES